MQRYRRGMRVEVLTQDISLAECEGKKTDFFNSFQPATERQVAKKFPGIFVVRRPP